MGLPLCRVLVADPPWSFGDTLPGPGRGAAKHYDCMSIESIKAFALPPMAPDAALFLWRVASMPQEALDVVRAWGFVPKTELVWLKRTSRGKRHFGMGRYLRAEHETCIVATRGRASVAVRNVRSAFEAPVGRHSAKPDDFFRIVESLYPLDEFGEHVELFARKRRAGWVGIGNELPPNERLHNLYELAGAAIHP